MSKTAAKSTGRAQRSTRLHRYIKEHGHSNILLKDIQRGLSNIGISLSKRVIEEREKQ